jgi:hypothetical protein
MQPSLSRITIRSPVRFEQAARALFGFLQFPIPVDQGFVMRSQLAHPLAHEAHADAHGGQGDAGQREQEAGADRKSVRVVT